ncbi:MAG: N-acetylneuraminate synthase family protein [Chromatiaceae bacterium]|nr:N-acetylneuraminate synthase family protein [Chromatiaceae bacterium]
MTELIAEVGLNHLGDAAKLKRMVTSAASVGLKIVKFQYRSDDKTFFHDDLEMGSTLVAQELATANLNKRVIVEACSLCRALQMSAGVSFFRKADLNDFCNLLVPDFIKIPSAEALNFELISAAKEYNVPVVVSTGGLTLTQLKALANHVDFDAQDCVMYCVANYPAALGATRPSMIGAYRSLFDCRIGYSSHDRDWEINIAYLQAGVDLLERHLCENKDDIGLDISTSSDVNEMARLQMFCDNSVWRLEASLSDKVPNQGEIQNLKDLGSGYYYDRDYAAGSLVPVSQLAVKSPCRGIRVGLLREFMTLRDTIRGAPVVEDDLLPDESGAKLDFDKLISRRVSLPVRFHDYRELIARFPLRNFEFHMSFRDVVKVDELKEQLSATLSQQQEFSVHLPDYISSSALIDPFSVDPQVREDSLRVLQRCIGFAHFLEEFTLKPCPIVGSFSVIQGSNKAEFYGAYRDLFVRILERESIAIMPQFLPKQAWYFGGSCELHAFCSLDDIEFYEAMPNGICLDTAHCIMAANSAGAVPSEWLRALLPLASHVHVSDALGEDGEGVIFGSGELGKDVSLVMLHSSVKVVEQWEGHLHNFKGFRRALSYLEDFIA